MTTETPTVPPHSLALWSQEAAEANDAIQAARMFLATGAGLPAGTTVDAMLIEAQELTERLRMQTRTKAGNFACAVPARDTSGRSSCDPFDLSALETLDTPDARELLALLEKAQLVADRVDESRGKALASSAGLLPGESRGTDLAESISLIALRLRTEIHGPTGELRE